jgi:uncharacterized lipoprotein YddW (UPF0748 family)
MKKFLVLFLAFALTFALVINKSNAESPSEKMKGICIHGEDIYKEGAKNVITKIKEYGYNTIFLLIKNPQGEVYYNSQFMPVKYPILSETIETAHNRGIKVFVYFPIFMDKNYGINHPSERMIRIDGTTNSYYISLLSDNYFQYIKRFISELTLFNIDGIAFDYIRFPNGSYDFSDKFISLAGSQGINTNTVKNIAYKTFVSPADWQSLFYAYNTDENVKKWIDMRKEIVQKEAYILKNYIKALNPHIKVGAFIVARGFQYTVNETSDIKKTFEYEVANFGQSPSSLSELDFIIPMVYLNSLDEPPEYTIKVAQKIKNNGKENVYIAANPYKVPPDDIEKELFYAFSYSEGVVLFRYPIFEMGKLSTDTTVEPCKTISAAIKTSSGKMDNITINTDSKDLIPTWNNAIFISPFYQYLNVVIQIGKINGLETLSPFYKNKTFLMDTAPFIKDNRTFVPIRFVSENLGAKVQWNGEKREVKIEDGATEIVMTIGKYEFIANGSVKKMDTAPFIKDDRTFVPIRFVSENLGAKVQWNGEKREVKIEKLRKVD